MSTHTPPGFAAAAPSLSRTATSLPLSSTPSSSASPGRRPRHTPPSPRSPLSLSRTSRHSRQPPPPPPPPPPLLPKNSVVLGAHTELGKLVVRELARAADVATIQALASMDPRDDIHLRPHEARKLRLLVTDLEQIERAVARVVSDPHVAFVCLGSSKKDLAAKGAYEFHKLNYDIPRRFVSEMFAMGVQRVAVFSAAGAHGKSKNEYLRVKGELIDHIKRMQGEKGRLAPSLGVFAVPLMLTNLKDQSGFKGSAISKTDRAKQTSALKFDMGPSKAVHVRDVAKAMCTDTLRNADREPVNELTYQFKKVKVDVSELSGKEIVDLAEETRAMQRRAYLRFRNAGGAGGLQSMPHRVSEFARQESSYAERQQRSTNAHGSFRYDRGDDNASHLSGRSGPLQEHEENEQGQSYYYYGSPRIGRLNEYGPAQPEVGRIEYFRESSARGSSVRSGDEGGRTADGSNVSHDSPVPPKLGGSVESLGQQLGRVLTKIRGNEVLSDVEHHRGSRRTRSPRLPSSVIRDTRYAQAIGQRPTRDSRGHSGRRRQSGQYMHSGRNSASSFRSLQGSQNSLGSPHPGAMDGDSVAMSEERRPTDETPRPYLRHSYPQHNPAYGFGESSFRSDSFHSSIADGFDAAEGNSFYGNGYSRRDGQRGEYESQPMPPMEVLSAFVRRVIAATDRPSRRPSSTERGPSQSEDRLEGQIRGTLDTRAVGQTSI